jgi:hypothetical protein
MCHRSVGLVSGSLERAGIPTATMSLRPEITFGVGVSRAAYARFPMGNPLGEPNRPDQQHLMIEALLGLLETAEGPGTFVELPFRWRRWEKWL